MKHAPPAKRSCYQCAHFHITFDERFPYGCHAMNFKSQRLPEQDVMEASGQACLSFSAKQPKRRQGTP